MAIDAVGEAPPGQVARLSLEVTAATPVPEAEVSQQQAGYKLLQDDWFALVPTAARTLVDRLFAVGCPEQVVSNTFDSFSEDTEREFRPAAQACKKLAKKHRALLTELRLALGGTR